VVIVATLATVAALALGISSMVRDGQVAHFDSEHWMASRVFLQAAAVLVLVVAFFVAT
jgi:phosphate starvation-inducible membrane PsiE